MSRESKNRIRQRNMGFHQEYFLRCPPHKDEDDFARQVIQRLRGTKGMVVCMDTLSLNVRYGVNTAGYTRNLVRELKKYRLSYRMRKYFGDRPPDFFRRIVDKFTGRREHCIVAFAVPQQDMMNELFQLKLLGEGAIFHICREGEDIVDLMKNLVSSAGLEEEKYERLCCTISDSSEFGELSVCGKFISLEEIQDLVKD